MGITVLRIQGSSACPLLKQEEGMDLAERESEDQKLASLWTCHPSSCEQIWIIGAERHMQMSSLACEVSPAGLHSGSTLAHLGEALAKGW